VKFSFPIGWGTTPGSSNSLRRPKTQPIVEREDLQHRRRQSSGFAGGLGAKHAPALIAKAAGFADGIAPRRAFTRSRRRGSHITVHAHYSSHALNDLIVSRTHGERALCPPKARNERANTQTGWLGRGTHIEAEPLPHAGPRKSSPRRRRLRGELSALENVLAVRMT